MSEIKPNPQDYDGKVTQEQIDLLETKRVVFVTALEAGSASLDDAREDYQTYAIKLGIDLSGKLWPGDTTPPTTEPSKPTEGTVKEGGWGANKDPDSWKTAQMKNPPEKFKVVDDTGINVATEFTTQANAQGYIDYYVWHKHNDQQPPSGGGGGGTPSGDKDQFGVIKIKKDKPGGRTDINFKLEEKMRNYASGKPSEWSTEYTCITTGDNSDVEATIYEMINGFKKEPDTVSLKLTGPAHKDGACCWVIPDFATDGSPKRTLETEKPHPHNHSVNPKPLSDMGGSIIGKWIGYKGITYVKDGKRFVESWIHFPVGNIDAPEQDKWRQYIPTTELGKEYLKANGKLCTSRLDGVKKGDPPTFKYASVREIVA